MHIPNMGLGPHNPKIRSHTLHSLSQPGAASIVLFLNIFLSGIVFPELLSYSLILLPSNKVWVCVTILQETKCFLEGESWDGRVDKILRHSFYAKIWKNLIFTEICTLLEQLRSLAYWRNSLLSSHHFSPFKTEERQDYWVQIEKSQVSISFAFLGYCLWKTDSYLQLNS